MKRALGAEETAEARRHSRRRREEKAVVGQQWTGGAEEEWRRAIDSSSLFSPTWRGAWRVEREREGGYEPQAGTGETRSCCLSSPFSKTGFFILLLLFSSA